MMAGTTIPRMRTTMARKIATTDRVDLAGLLEFLRARHRGVLITTRADGRPQASPVTFGVDEGRLVVATYPQRAKTRNVRSRPSVSMCVLSDDFDGPWVQVDGRGEVLDVPEAVEPLVGYYRAVAGEHPDWVEYRQAMVAQGKSLIQVEIEDWGPVATGGFPQSLAEEGA
jgi:PPOX class probable F420-dependent enzyme